MGDDGNTDMVYFYQESTAVSEIHHTWSVWLKGKTNYGHVCAQMDIRRKPQPHTVHACIHTQVTVTEV